MDLNSFASLNCRPFLSELLHHFLPDEEGLVSKLIYSFFCLFLELEKAETSLYCCRFLHQKLQVCVGNTSLVRSPVLLNDSCRENGTFLAFEH